MTVNRTLVGVIALVLLLAAGGLGLWGTDKIQELWAGACLKVGLLMGTFWLALPTLTKNRELGRVSWATLLGAILIALIVARTKVSPYVLVTLLAASVLAVRILGPRRISSHSRPKRDF